MCSYNIQHIDRLLKTETGIVVSILLGLGLASLFRKVCHDDKCLRFNGSVFR